eukprot:1963403-Rhodomonas_salina.1
MDFGDPYICFFFATSSTPKFRRAGVLIDNDTNTAIYYWGGIRVLLVVVVLASTTPCVHCRHPSRGNSTGIHKTGLGAGFRCIQGVADSS